MTSRAVACLLLAVAGACDGVGEPIRARVIGDAGAAFTCRETLSGTVALWDFEELPASVRDSAGAHPGRIVDGMVGSVPGPAGCGRAAWFDETSAGYVLVPDAPAWQLPVGSVDFWFRANACSAQESGVVTRDAEFTMRPGHFRVFWRNDCRLAVRVQNQANETGGVEIATLGGLALEQWHHVGINFGAPGLELVLDGRSQGFAPVDWGIDGNQNAWVMGVSNDKSLEGTGAPVWKPLRAAGIDRVRVTDRRQPFARPTM